MTPTQRDLARVAASNAGPHSWETVFKAWHLRMTTDLSLRDIAASLNCSPTSIINWCNDINARLARISVTVNRTLTGE